MANVLKVTTPTVERTNLNPVRPEGNLQAQDLKVQNPVSTERVTRPDVRNDAAAESGDQKLRLNYGSNFSAFVKGLGKNPELIGTLSRLIQAGQGMQVESGIGEDTAEEISALLNMIHVQEGEMQGLMKNQLEAATRFRSPFFDLLRQALSETDSPDLQQDLLRFVKRYVDVTSARHLQTQLKDTLDAARDRMLKKSAETFSGKMEGLFETKDGRMQIPEDVRRLKGEILPFLNAYITASHDRGSLRELTANLALLLSRYENADRAELLNDFNRLQEYAVFQKYFGKIDTKQFDALLTRMEELQRQNSAENQKLYDVIKDGLMGKEGSQVKQLAGNLLQSLLLNESVYMPLLHLVLPMNVDGRLLYSEAWIDPDAAKPQGRQEEKKNAVRALIKFDIQEVGFFDLYLYYFDGKADVQLNYPDSYKGKEGEIRENMRRIMKERGIDCGTLILESSEGSIPLSEAFPEIYERRNTINVRV